MQHHQNHQIGNDQHHGERHWASHQHHPHNLANNTNNYSEFLQKFMQFSQIQNNQNLLSLLKPDDAVEMTKVQQNEQEQFYSTSMNLALLSKLITLNQQQQQHNQLSPYQQLLNLNKNPLLNYQKMYSPASICNKTISEQDSIKYEADNYRLTNLDTTCSEGSMAQYSSTSLIGVKVEDDQQSNILQTQKINSEEQQIYQQYPYSPTQTEKITTEDFITQKQHSQLIQKLQKDDLLQNSNNLHTKKSEEEFDQSQEDIVECEEDSETSSLNNNNHKQNIKKRSSQRGIRKLAKIIINIIKSQKEIAYNNLVAKTEEILKSQSAECFELVREDRNGTLKKIHHIIHTFINSGIMEYNEQEKLQICNNNAQGLKMCKNLNEKINSKKKELHQKKKLLKALQEKIQTLQLLKKRNFTMIQNLKKSKLEQEETSVEVEIDSELRELMEDYKQNKIVKMPFYIVQTAQKEQIQIKPLNGNKKRICLQSKQTFNVYNELDFLLISKKNYTKNECGKGQ